jgi:hypothetical protein
MDDDAKITLPQRGVNPDASCYQYGELRHLIWHSTEQKARRGEATRVSRLSGSLLKAPGFAGILTCCDTGLKVRAELDPKG